LYLRVRPIAKVWVYRYKQLGKEAKLNLGYYPLYRWFRHERRRVLRPKSELTVLIHLHPWAVHGQVDLAGVCARLRQYFGQDNDIFVVSLIKP
jgi:hypothetical protein